MDYDESPHTGELAVVVHSSIQIPADGVAHGFVLSHVQQLE